MNLKEFFVLHPKAALAFSGGVDSAYLLYAAKQYAEEVQAYYVKSEFQPQFERDDAVRLASELGVDMKVFDLHVLSVPCVKENPSDRCYYCKKAIFGAIMEAAKSDGFSVLLDGTNASDDAGDRPGMRALEELSVLSPLRECGLTKLQIRQLSKEAGLFTWELMPALLQEYQAVRKSHRISYLQPKLRKTICFLLDFRIFVFVHRMVTQDYSCQSRNFHFY